MKYFYLITACLFYAAGYAQISWPEGKKAAVVLTYDDGVQSHLQVVVPQLEARNMHGTFYLFGQAIRSADINEWRTVSAGGHELGNHSLYHPCLQGTVNQTSGMCRSLECYTVKDMIGEIALMNNFLYAIDKKDIYSYAYPCGQSTAGGEDYSQPLIQSGLVNYARGGAGGIITDAQTLDISKVPVLSIPEGCRADQLIGYVKDIVKQNGAGVFVFHGVGGDYLTVDEQEHAQFLDYINAHSDEIWVTTFSKAMDWIISQKAESAAKDDITVACYYFPNYHTGDARNEMNKGAGWSEWELVKEAKPRFPNHDQPKIPAWGYTDEKDPVAMAQKIDAAADHGVDVFIFDWYMYEDGPFLNACLDEGFLKAENTDRVRFSLMWANHDWVEIHPYRKGSGQKLLYPAKVSPQRYDEICAHLINDYFLKPNYWLIDGKPYFSIYDVQKFVEGFGSLEATRKAMDKLRDMAKEAGLKGVHWNLVAWGNPILPVEKAPANTAELIKELGFDSATSYVWIHHASLPDTMTDYNTVRDIYFSHWKKAKAEYGAPYFPNVTMGWDSTPRCHPDDEWENVGYPFMNTIGNNTPANFKQALQKTKEKLLEDPNGPRILNINCWNEWTEGSYLEPDTRTGTSYLEAVKEVFD